MDCSPTGTFLLWLRIIINPPTVKTTSVIYNTSSNGRTSIHLHLAKVFPLPNCTLALENNYYQFRNTTIARHSVYYEVFLNCEVSSCNIKPEIHCHLIKEYTIPWTMFLACKENQSIWCRDRSSHLKKGVQPYVPFKITDRTKGGSLDPPLL
ncbi:Hypothetical predicted protein [Mytilus galloprovincialis]|uniref:Uncharacterized protein n=1 Tax=Mytilus galloprovincialis TaxID=29158 RepID=A0A8B6CMG8_MYTGA|nr:Hypothetical predicted protein [Mytilus galloprovincialis]